ncbi:MAG: DUF433 domain-containing protein [Bacteroidota bacterium]
MSWLEKAKLVSQAVQDVGGEFPGIEKTPGVCGGSACIIRTRIPVWLLVSCKKLGFTDEELLEDYPSLRRQDLRNAWVYYEANKEEIEQDIRENEEV